MSEDCTLEVAGRAIAVTSPHKVFFSERGATKLDLVRYYLAVAEPLMRAAGSLPGLRIGTNGNPIRSAKGAPNKNPRDSMPTIA